MQNVRKDIFCSSFMLSDQINWWFDRYVHSLVRLNTGHGKIQLLSFIWSELIVTNKSKLRPKWVWRLFHHKWKRKNSKNAYHSKKKLSSSFFKTFLHQQRSRVYRICSSDEMRARWFLCKNIYLTLHSRWERLFKNPLQKAIISNPHNNSIEEYRRIFRSIDLHKINERALSRLWQKR